MIHGLKHFSFFPFSLQFRFAEDKCNKNIYTALSLSFSAVKGIKRATIRTLITLYKMPN